MKNVAVVILNWNGKELLKPFLPAVIEHSNGARIIVADNASSDDSMDYLKANFPEVETIQNKENGGFAKGYNDALKQIDAEFYVLLNSDVEVTPNWLTPLLEAMKDQNVAGCQPKVLAHGRKDHFEHAGAAGGFIDKNYYPFCRGRIFEEVEIDQHQYDTTTEIFWTTGACMMIRSEVFHRVGGFDEDFFAHMEEIDLCWRIKKMNHSFLAVPASTVFHVGGGTLPYSSPQKVYLNFRNNLYMIGKNHEGLLFPKLVYRLALDGLAGVQFLFSGKFNAFWAVIRAHFAHHGNLGKTLRKRKEIKAQSTTFNHHGLYRGNILWAFFAKGKKKFSELDQDLLK